MIVYARLWLVFGSCLGTVARMPGFQPLDDIVVALLHLQFNNLFQCRRRTYLEPFRVGSDTIQALLEGHCEF